jgi:hypothetical protein
VDEAVAHGRQPPDPAPAANSLSLRLMRALKPLEPGLRQRRTTGPKNESLAFKSGPKFTKKARKYSKKTTKTGNFN